VLVDLAARPLGSTPTGLILSDHHVNTGCCSFRRRRRDRIRLVRWLDDDGEPLAQILGDDALGDVLAEVAGRR
jgi:hypothetical protein